MIFKDVLNFKPYPNAPLHAEFMEKLLLKFLMIHSMEEAMAKVTEYRDTFDPRKNVTVVPVQEIRHFKHTVTKHIMPGMPEMGKTKGEAIIAMMVLGYVDSYLNCEHKLAFGILEDAAHTPAEAERRLILIDVGHFLTEGVDDHRADFSRSLVLRANPNFSGYELSQMGPADFYKHSSGSKVVHEGDINYIAHLVTDSSIF
jgi:hypothetical protein